MPLIMPNGKELDQNDVDNILQMLESIFEGYQTSIDEDIKDFAPSPALSAIYDNAKQQYRDSLKQIKNRMIEITDQEKKVEFDEFYRK